MKQLNLIARRRRSFKLLRRAADASIMCRMALASDGKDPLNIDSETARIYQIRELSRQAEQVARDYYASLQ